MDDRAAALERARGPDASAAVCRRASAGAARCAFGAVSCLSGCARYSATEQSAALPHAARNTRS